MMMQVMGNSEKTWDRYYNLKGATRQGQEALQGMAPWRDGMDAILVASAEDGLEDMTQITEVDDVSGEDPL